jgi:pimeloyl-ACP methyl ester carboxylesterase
LKRQAASAEQASSSPGACRLVRKGTEVATPFDLPHGRVVRLPGRGTTFVRESSPSHEAPTILLIHGLTMTADLNWFGVFPALARQFRVVALDLRGHGRGMPVGYRFRLEECADDIAALADVLGIDRFIAVGYSMGGLVAQLLWRRHPERVAGLVLCSTARNFRGSVVERLTALVWPALGAAAQLSPVLHFVGAHHLGAKLLGHVDDSALRGWATSEMARTTLATATSAIHAVSEFTSHEWIRTVDVPTAVVVTTLDRIVPVTRQLKLAHAIPNVILHEINADHGVCVNAAANFGRELLEVCRLVSARVTPEAGSLGDLA